MMKFHPFVWSSIVSSCIGSVCGHVFYLQTNENVVMSVAPPLWQQTECASQSTQGGLCLTDD